MTFNKTKLALGVAATAFSLAIAAPQAFADATSAQRTADEAAQKAQALETQLQQMSTMMQSMKAELDKVKAASENVSTANAKVQELDKWMSSVKSAPEAASAKDGLIAVRGGWEQLDSARGAGDGFGLTSGGTVLSNNINPSGFYFGGAFDFNVNNDLFGLWDDTSFQVELGVEYSQFGTGQNLLTNVVNGNLGISPGKSTDARLRINASPKIKFFHGSKFRPWIIPVGLEINILGVPSNAVSVLNSGMQFGTGAEYELFRGIVLGADARYHYATSSIDGTVTNGVSTGGYVGFKF